MVIAWLLNFVSMDILSSISFLPTAHQIWEDLKNRFTQGHLPQIYQIKKDIFSCVQGPMSINSYFTKFRGMWDELTNLSQLPRCVCNCSCGAVQFCEENENTQKLLQFLMGLNDNFSHIRSTILAKSPAPDITTAVSILINEEKTNKCFSTSLPLPVTEASTALVARTFPARSSSTSY